MITMHSGCSDAIVPIRSLHLTTIAIFDSLDSPLQNITHLLTGAINDTIILLYNGVQQYRSTSEIHLI